MRTKGSKSNSAIMRANGLISESRAPEFEAYDNSDEAVQKLKKIIPSDWRVKVVDYIDSDYPEDGWDFEVVLPSKAVLHIQAGDKDLNAAIKSSAKVVKTTTRIR